MNHELRSAGATARKGHRGRREDKDVKDDRLDFLCTATGRVYKVHDKYQESCTNAVLIVKLY